MHQYTHLLHMVVDLQACSITNLQSHCELGGSLHTLPNFSHVKGHLCNSFSVVLSCPWQAGCDHVAITYRLHLKLITRQSIVKLLNVWMHVCIPVTQAVCGIAICMGVAKSYLVDIVPLNHVIETREEAV